MGTFNVGTDQYDNAKLQSAMYKNIDAYAKIQHLSKKERQAFKDAVGYTIKGMQDGTISSIDVDSNLIDSKGEGNEMMGQTIHYMKDLIANDTGSALAPKKKNVYDKNLNNSFKDYFNAGKDIDETFITNWKKQDKGTDTTNRAAQLSKFLQYNLDNIDKYNTDDIDVYNQKANLTAAIEALKDGKLGENEYTVLSKVGLTSIDPMFTEKPKVVTPEEEPDFIKEIRATGKSEGWSNEMINQKIEDERTKRTNQFNTEHDQAVKANQKGINEKNWNDYYNTNYNNTYNKSWDLGHSSFKTSEAYEQALVNQNLDPNKYFKFWLNNPEGSTNGISDLRWLKNYLIYLYNKDKTNNFIEGSNGNQIIIPSINYTSGKALAFNPISRQLVEVSPNDEKLKDILRSNWYQNINKPVQSKKEGGTLKFLSGGELDQIKEVLTQKVSNGEMTAEEAQNYYDQAQQQESSNSIPEVTQYDFLNRQSTTSKGDFLTNIRNKISKRQTQEFQNRAAAKGRTVEAQKYYEGTGAFDASDTIRAVNLVNDLTSIASSYVPVYGTAVAGIQGLASMGADLVADAMDSKVSRDDMFKNLAANAGFAGLGMIPGGVGKFGKIWKNVKKLAPALMSVAGAVGAVNDPEIQKTLSKISSDKSADKFTNEDWKNIMYLGKMIAFGHNTSKAASQAFNRNLYNSAAPSVIRNFGEWSIGPKRARLQNTAILRQGNLEKIALSKKGNAKTININTSDGSRKIVLTENAAKALNNIIKNNTTKGVLNKSKALNEINSFVNDKLKMDPSELTSTNVSAFKGITTKKNIDFVNSNLTNEAEVNTITDKVKLGDKEFKLTSQEVAELKNNFEAASADGNGGNTKITEGIKAVNEYLKSLYKGNRVLTEETPVTFTTTLTTAELADPGSFNFLRSNKNLLGLSTTTSKNRYSKDLFKGNSEQAAANRLLLLANNRIGNSKWLSTNWEMQQGAGPFKSSELLGQINKSNKIESEAARQKIINKMLANSDFKDLYDQLPSKNLSYQEMSALETLSTILPNFKSNKGITPEIQTALQIKFPNLQHLNKAQLKTKLKIFLKEYTTDPNAINHFIKYQQGGTINFYRKGAAISNLKKIASFSGGGKSNNMNFSDSSQGWKSAIYDKYKGDIQSKINSKTGEDLVNYINWLNSMQDQHSALYNKYGSDYTTGINFDQDVQNYQTAYDNNDIAGYNTGENKDAINQAYAANRYVPVGNTTRVSGDSSASGFKADGFYGAITDDRRLLGRKGDLAAEDLKANNEFLNTKGYEMYLDPKTNYYKIKPIDTKYQETGDLHTGLQRWDKIKEIGKGIVNKIGDNADNILEYANYLQHQRSNKKITELNKEALKPVLQDYINSHLTVLRDVNAEQTAQRNAGKLNTDAAKVRTSDASLQTAAQQDAQTRGQEGILQADVVSNQKAQEMAYKNAALQIDNQQKNQQISYANRTAEQAAQTARLQQDSMLEAAQSTNLDNLLKGQIYKIKTDKADAQAKNDLVMQYRIKHIIDSNPEYNRLSKEFTRLNNIVTRTAKEEQEYKNTYDQLLELSKKLTKEGEDQYLAYLQNDKQLQKEETPKYKYKEGAKIDTSLKKIRSTDDKEFNKNIKNSVDATQKAIDNLSRATILSIKKALNL